MQPTILIVDDEKHTRDGLRRFVRGDKYQPIVAADTASAIEVFERDQIDVLLTDLRLGGEDGMNLIERALKTAASADLYHDDCVRSVDTAVEAMKRGAYDFVTKPLNLDKVETVHFARLEQSPNGTGKSRIAAAGRGTFRA